MVTSGEVTVKFRQNFENVHGKNFEILLCKLRENFQTILEQSPAQLRENDCIVHLLKRFWKKFQKNIKNMKDK